MRLELGGGEADTATPGWVNVDVVESAEIRHDLDAIPWPFETGSVEAIYSSHCLEHLADPFATLFEISRICAVGASVTVRVPDPLAEVNFFYQHTGCLSEVWFRNTLEYLADRFWNPDAADGKILRIEGVEKFPDHTWFPRARACRWFEHWTDEEILQWVPRTCHENEFRMTVVEH